MENLFWIVVSFILSQIVICVWIYTNLSDIKADHEKLKAELIQRLFIGINQNVRFDLKTVLGVLIKELEYDIEVTSGLKLTKKPVMGLKKRK